MIKLVILNLESIIIFDKEAVNNAFLTAFSHFGYELTPFEMDNIADLPFDLAIEMLLTSQGLRLQFISEKYLKKIHQLFLQTLFADATSVLQVSLESNIESLFLDLLKNDIKIGLYSDFSREHSQIMLEKLNWQAKSWTQNIFYTQEHENNLPPYFKVFQIMELHEVKKIKAVAKIATTPLAVRTANHAACSYVIGFAKLPLVEQKLKQENCTHIINHLEELYPLFSLGIGEK